MTPLVEAKRFTACRPCRRAKIKCNTSSTPCGRCSRLNVRCERDRGYRRRSTRDHENTPATNGYDTRAASTGSEEQRAVLPENRFGQGPPQFYTLDETSLLPKQAQELFRVFFAHYHEWLPFLEGEYTYEQYWFSLDLLFWSLILTACRSEAAYTHLIPQLSQSVLRRLWERITKPPLTLEDIQVCIIICTWPPPKTRFWTEPSSVILGAAIFSAYSLGINRAATGSKQLISEKPKLIAMRLEPIMTWIALNITAQNLSENFGHPPMLQLTADSTVERACRAEIIVPSKLLDCLVKARYSYQIASVMSSDPENDVGLPPDLAIVDAVNDIDGDLCQNNPTHSMATINGIRLQCARLQAHIYLLFTAYDTPGREAGLVKATEIAAEIIKIITSSQEWYNLLAYAPAHFLRSSLFVPAALFNKLVHSSMSKHHEGLEIARIAGPVTIDPSVLTLLFRSAVFALRRCAVIPEDFSGKGANLLERMWEYCRDDPKVTTRPPRMFVRTRMGTGLVYDALWVSYRTLKKPVPFRIMETADNNGNEVLAPTVEGPDISEVLNVDERDNEEPSPSFADWCDTNFVDWIWDEEMENTLQETTSH